MTHATDRCRAFHRLHGSGCFVIPNPWDVGSARVLAQLGFPALATTSSGFAWSRCSAWRLFLPTEVVCEQGYSP